MPDIHTAMNKLMELAVQRSELSDLIAGIDAEIEFYRYQIANPRQ
jgi:hypothetical protein